MTTPALITLGVVIGALILFLTEALSIDLVAMLIMIILILTGVVTPQQGVEGFAHDATLTVMFMFAISAALFKTGALQNLSNRLSGLFRTNFNLGLLGLMVVIASFSGFLNNTPIVALLIPICIQIARSAGRTPSKILMPLSFATILGGTVTLIGTSTNLVVSGLSQKSGGPEIHMFDPTPLGVIYCLVGLIYMAFVGIRLLPDRKNEADLQKKFGMRDYLTELELLPEAPSVGKKILESAFVNDLDLDILEVRRGEARFTLPPGDFVLAAGDVLKVRCDVEKIKKLKDRARVLVKAPVRIGDDDLKGRRSTLVEMVLTANSHFEGQTIRELDFRHAYRAVPLALRHRDEIIHEGFYDTKLKAGDIILAEVKSHFVKELKQMEQEQESPFVLLSEDTMVEFDLRKFALVMLIIGGVIAAASFNVVPMLVAALVGVATLVLTRCMTMRDVYESISWDVVFLLAGTLCLGTAMKNCGLDQTIADALVSKLHGLGPVAVVSGLYFVTMVLTEIMSNNAAAALLTPIGVAIATKLGVNPMPFLMAIMFGASASFATPVGYQTNSMVYSAGQYKFLDFMRVGGWLNILLWVVASILIPILYPF